MKKAQNGIMNRAKTKSERMNSNPTNIDGENIDLAGYSISDIDMYFMYKNSGEGMHLEKKMTEKLA